MSEVIVNKERTKTTATIDGILFNNVNGSGTRQALKATKSDNPWGSSTDDGKLSAIVNAVDIDWNGATPEEGVEINNTGEFFNWLKNAAGEPGADGKSAYDLYRESVEEKPARGAIYSFVSFEKGNQENQYGYGQVEAISVDEEYTTVKVLSNETNNPNVQNAESFVGQIFKVHATELTQNAVYDLLVENDNELVDISISVTVELVSDAQEAVVAMTKIQWLASLRGEQGPAGPQGIQGEPGVGTKGDKGDKGEDGKSAYELYKDTVDEKEAQPAIYAFESFNNSSKEVKYGEGKVKVIEMRAGGATVEVIENQSTDPNAEDFVGQQFNIATALATDEPIQLFTLNNEPVGIWVTVTLVSNAQEAVVAMTQEQWLASLKGETGTFDSSDLEDYATKTYVDGKITDLINAAPAELDTLKEIADKLGDDDDAISAINNTIATKANAADVYTKTEIDNAGYLTSHQDISGKANAADVYSKTDIDNKLGEFGNSVESQEAVYYTQEEIDAAQAGDDAYGKTVEDIKTPAVQAVPYTVKGYIEEIEEVIAAALVDLNTKVGGIYSYVGDLGINSTTGNDFETIKEYIDAKFTYLSDWITQLHPTQNP